MIVPDLRGYGGSDAPPDDAEHTVYSKRRMALDIVGLMDALGLERAHVIGVSFGGLIALDFALSHPERVFSRGELLERGWDAPDHRLERTIDSHIKSLRNKLREIDPEANPICTHRGMGYSLVPGA